MLECPDGRQPTALVGFGVISLKEGCTITSREFHYPHTFRGIVEISISSGSFTREVTSHCTAVRKANEGLCKREVSNVLKWAKLFVHV